MVTATKIGTNAVQQFQDSSWAAMKGCFIEIGGKKHDRYGWVETANAPAEAKTVAKAKTANAPAEAKTVAKAIEANELGSLTAEDLYQYIQESKLFIKNYRNLTLSDLFEAVKAAQKTAKK